MFEIDTNSKKPIYIQIVDNVRDLISRNILREEDKMPSVRELARTLKINISTVQKAYAVLENEKIIVTHIGRGTFITNNLAEIKLNYDLLDNLILELIREARLLGISKEELIEKIKHSLAMGEE